MRIRATATATSRSNAVGALELECSPHGLRMGFFGVGAFAEDFAPGALTTGTQLTVPWSALRQVRADAEELYLELDWPSLPHDRLTLRKFTTGDPVPRDELRRRRWVLGVGAVATAALASLGAAAVVPHLSAAEVARLTLAVGGLAAAAVLVVGYVADRRVVDDGSRSPELRHAFLAELETYFPALERSDAPPPPPPKKRTLPNLAGLMPRTVATVTITLTACILAALVSGRRVLSSSAPQAEVPPQVAFDDTARPAAAPLAPPPATAVSPEPPRAPAPSTAPASPTHAAAAPEVSVLQRCLCQRAASPLWEAPIPKLSSLLLESKRLPGRTRDRTSLEIALVNNSSEAVREITLHVRFYEGEGKRREQVKDKPLYFEGPLAPGSAIKWRTEARGTSWELDTPYIGEISPDGEGAAPVAAFKELLAANNRPVRLHAARLLAYLGAPEAAAAALELKDALRTAEAPYLRRVLAALADVRVCDVEENAQHQLEACVYNASDADREEIGVHVAALDRALMPNHPVSSPPQILGDQKWLLPAKLPAQSGVRVRLPITLSDLGSKPGQPFELNADRFELLD